MGLPWIIISCMQGGTANRAPVLSLTQCLIACESAPGCSVATYSPGDQNCFLKGCPSKYAVTCPVCSFLVHLSLLPAMMA